jgi:hypothetical protein
MLSGLSLFLSADVDAPCACRGMSFFGFSITSLLFFALLLYFAVKLLRRRRKGKPGRKERTELDRWVDDVLARELHKKLAVERETVQRALEGTPEPEAVGTIEEAVRSVQVKFARTPEGGFEARLEVAFEDGSSATASRLLTNDEVPKEVRDEFARTGGSYVFRTVHFPWAEPNRWS